MNEERTEKCLRQVEHIRDNYNKADRTVFHISPFTVKASTKYSNNTYRKYDQYSYSML